MRYCLRCRFTVSAMSLEALEAAERDHEEYVNYRARVPPVPVPLP